MKTLLFTNKDKDPGLAVTERVKEILRAEGIQCALFNGEPGAFENADAVLSLGGDGTFLRCAKLSLPHGVPVLGIGLGHTGFLSRIDPDNLEVLRGLAHFPVAERSVLEARIMRDGETVRSCLAVNDAVFSRGAAVQTVSLSLEADGTALGSFLGDGVIVSTATGSTGYAFSAGGPVADPALSCMLITPICAHASRDHAFVMSPGRVLTIKPSYAERRQIFISTDGEEPARLEPGDTAELRISGMVLRCLEPEENRFFDNVRIYRL
ncbi:MAG: NAD(+)/NADH kinase [Oscillospiraceae bacterium]|jgi:NAD+ kinase|nr:NAD(+)/NADH kinase [Oscillospiraceae bacterium]